MNMEEASKRLLAEHRRLKARSSRMLSVLLLFAAAYLMTGMKWAVLPGIVYLAIVYQKIGNGRALIARAYQQEEKTFLKQINALISEETDSAGQAGEKALLACAYLEEGTDRRPCLVWRSKERIWILADAIEKRKVYEVSGQAMYLLGLKEKTAGAWSISLGIWRRRPESHLEYLTEWARKKEDYSCMEYFVCDQVLQGLLEGRSHPVRFAAEKSRLKRQELWEWKEKTGVRLILTSEQKLRLRPEKGERML